MLAPLQKEVDESYDNVYDFDSYKKSKRNDSNSNNDTDEEIKKPAQASHYVYPIKRLDDIKAIQKYYLDNKQYRNLLLFNLGINVALRISDLLELTWEHIFDNHFEIRDGITVVEKKTRRYNKKRQLKYNRYFKKAINDYLNQMNLKPKELNMKSYIFTSRQSSCITSHRAGEIIQEACKAIGFTDNVNTHTLRKTFCYRYYMQTKNIAKIQMLLKHRNQEVTFRYIDVTDINVAEVFDKVNWDKKTREELDMEESNSNKIFDFDLEDVIQDEQTELTEVGI